MEIFENAPERADAWRKRGRAGCAGAVVEDHGVSPAARRGPAGNRELYGRMQDLFAGGCVEGPWWSKRLRRSRRQPACWNMASVMVMAFAVGVGLWRALACLVERFGAGSMPFDVLLIWCAPARTFSRCYQVAAVWRAGGW